MAKSWKIKNRSVAETKQAIQDQLAKSEIPSSAIVQWKENDLEVTIEKAGKSQFVLSLSQAGTDTTISETERSIAFMHRPFVGKVEVFVDELFSKIS